MAEEAAIEHGMISCSAMHIHGNLLVGGANANSMVSSLDTSATTKLVPNNVVRTELQARMPREYNVRVSGDFKTTTGGFATEIQDTFPVDPHGRIDNNNGVGIKIPANGVYFSNLNLDMTSDAEETVLKLQPQGYFQLGGSASNFQQNAAVLRGLRMARYQSGDNSSESDAHNRRGRHGIDEHPATRDGEDRESVPTSGEQSE